METGCTPKWNISQPGVVKMCLLLKIIARHAGVLHLALWWPHPWHRGNWAISRGIQMNVKAIGKSPCLIYWQQSLDVYHIPEMQDKKLWPQDAGWVGRGLCVGLAERRLAPPGSSQMSIAEEKTLRGVSKGRFAWCCLSQVAATWKTPPGWSNLRNLEVKTKSLGSKGISLGGLRVTLTVWESQTVRDDQAMGSSKSHRGFVNWKQNWESLWIKSEQGGVFLLMELWFRLLQKDDCWLN